MRFVPREWRMDFPNSELEWGDKHVLFNEALNCWDYTAPMADDLRSMGGITPTGEKRKYLVKTLS